MNITEAVMSGIVQGITEFLPISSDGHLALLHHFFGWTGPKLFFDLCLHMATVAAVVLYFYRDIVEIFSKKDAKTAGCILVSMIPAGVVGVLFDEKIEQMSGSAKVVSAFFLVTAAALFAAHWAMKNLRPRENGVSYGKALLIGTAQAAALLPGVSRSGMTVSTGVLSGLAADKAFRFSFLMSVPIILAAFAYKALKIDFASEIGNSAWAYAAGFVAAAMVGLMSLSILDRVIKSRKLFIFGIYCLFVGVVGILFL